jgi:hypothetical protein
MRWLQKLKKNHVIMKDSWIVQSAPSTQDFKGEIE